VITQVCSCLTRVDDIVWSPGDAFDLWSGAVHRGPGGVDAGRARGIRALEINRGVADVDGVGHGGTKS